MSQINLHEKKPSTNHAHYAEFEKRIREQVRDLLCALPPAEVWKPTVKDVRQIKIVADTLSAIVEFTRSWR